MQKKKILIISMTGGFGHIRAGQALLDYAKENLLDVEAKHVDIFDINTSLKEISVKAYDLVSKKMPFLWGLTYAMLDNPFFSFFIKRLGHANWLFNDNMRRYIYDQKPDVILFTNIVPLPLLAPACRKMFPAIVMGVVVTDYHGHAYYHIPSIDYYFVATGQVQEDLQKVGIQKEKIIVTGIPIDPKFFIQENIPALKLTHGIQNDFPVVMLIASFKISKKDLLSAIGQILNFKPNINLICLSNGNQDFYDAIREHFLNHERFLLVNWTDVPEEYMKMADVVISKAGGLTVSECLTLQKPLIMVNPIPGQEEHNAEFVQKHNRGITVSTVKEMMNALPDMLALAKNRPVSSLILPDNPSEKIFKTIIQ